MNTLAIFFYRTVLIWRITSMRYSYNRLDKVLAEKPLHVKLIQRRLEDTVRTLNAVLVTLNKLRPIDPAFPVAEFDQMVVKMNHSLKKYQQWTVSNTWS